MQQSDPQKSPELSPAIRIDDDTNKLHSINDVGVIPQAFGYHIQLPKFFFIFETESSRSRFLEQPTWTNLLQEYHIEDQFDLMFVSSNIPIIQNTPSKSLYPPSHKQFTWSEDIITGLTKFAWENTDEELINQLQKEFRKEPPDCKSRTFNKWNGCDVHIKNIQLLKIIFRKLQGNPGRQNKLFQFGRDYVTTCNSKIKFITDLDIIINLTINFSKEEKKAYYKIGANLIKEIHSRDGFTKSFFLFTHLFLFTELLSDNEGEEEALSLLQISQNIILNLDPSVKLARIKKSTLNLQNFVAEKLEKKMRIRKSKLLIGEIIDVLNEHEIILKPLGQEEILVNTDEVDIVFQENPNVSITVKELDFEKPLDITFKYNVIDDKNISSHDIQKIFILPPSQVKDIYFNSDDDSESEHENEVFLSKKLDIIIEDIEDSDIGDFEEITSEDETFEEHALNSEVFEDFNKYLVENLSNDPLVNSLEVETISSSIVKCWKNSPWFESFWISNINNCYNEATGMYLLPEDVNVKDINNQVNYNYCFKERFKKGINKRKIVDLTSEFMILKAKKVYRDKATERGKTYPKVKNEIVDIEEDDADQDDAAAIDKDQEMLLIGSKHSKGVKFKIEGKDSVVTSQNVFDRSVYNEDKENYIKIASDKQERIKELEMQLKELKESHKEKDEKLKYLDLTFAKMNEMMESLKIATEKDQSQKLEIDNLNRELHNKSVLINSLEETLDLEHQTYETLMEKTESQMIQIDTLQIDLNNKHILINSLEENLDLNKKNFQLEKDKLQEKIDLLNREDKTSPQKKLVTSVNVITSMMSVFTLNLDENQLLSSTSVKQKFPRASGLKYATSSGCWRLLIHENGYFHPPEDGWGEKTFVLAEEAIPASNAVDLRPATLHLPQVTNYGRGILYPAPVPGSLPALRPALLPHPQYQPNLLNNGQIDSVNLQNPVSNHHFLPQFNGNGPFRLLH